MFHQHRFPVKRERGDDLEVATAVTPARAPDGTSPTFAPMGDASPDPDAAAPSTAQALQWGHNGSGSTSPTAAAPSHPPAATPAEAEYNKYYGRSQGWYADPSWYCGRGAHY
jgi:hypothetical protein